VSTQDLKLIYIHL